MEQKKFDEAMGTAKKGLAKNKGAKSLFTACWSPLSALDSHRYRFTLSGNNELNGLLRTCKARKAGPKNEGAGGQQFSQEMMELNQKYQVTQRELHQVRAKGQANARDQKRWIFFVNRGLWIQR